MSLWRRTSRSRPVARDPMGAASRTLRCGTMGERVVDPVCRMTVDLDHARAKGLVSPHAGSEYGFCSPGCKRAFERDPQRYLR